VSQHIAALERAVGGAVFDRPGGPRPVRLTPLGSVVLAHGRELLVRADDLTHAVDRFRAGEGRIDIGTFQSVSTVILPSVVRRLRDEYPGCDIRLSEEEEHEPQLDDLDLLFYDGLIEGDTEHVKLLDDPYLLVAVAGAFPDGPVALPLLDDHPMVAQLSMVLAGLGSTVLPWLAIRGAGVLNDPRLRVHELRPAVPPRKIYLHWRATRSPSPLTRRAIEIATEVAAESRWRPGA
jgi:DNA-binding transcriptional LysR family regulator